MSIDTRKEEMQEPWPIHDVVSKLVEASEILLHKKNYDGHGWEEISHAVAYAKQWLEEKEIELPDCLAISHSYQSDSGAYQYLLHVISNISQNLNPDGSLSPEWVQYLFNEAFPQPKQETVSNAGNTDDLPF